MNRTFLLPLPMVAAAALAMASGSALARHDRHVEYARVTHVEPIIASSSYEVPREQCWTESVPVERGGPRSYTAPIVGALIGGALGNAVGHHSSSQKVGAVVGAALGASVANDISNRREGGYRDVAYRDQEVCQVTRDRAYREEVVAYRVSYRHRGRDYVTEMPYDPGRRLPVNVDVQPVRW